MNILILITTLMSCSNKVMKLKDKPLLEAIISGNMKELIASLKYENVNMPDRNGRTPLGIAAEKGNLEAIKVLIAAGADVNYATEYRYTALMNAAHKGNLEAIRVLIAAGADVNYATKDGYTALIIATINERLKAIEALIEAKADVNYVPEYGNTALMCAAKGGNLEAIRALIKAKANVNDINNGNTALICATQQGNLEAIKELMASGADVNQATADGYTALMWATQHGRIEAITALMKGEADVNAINSNGIGAIMCAETKGCLLSFMKSYAKVKFNLPDDVPEVVVFNSASILLLQSSTYPNNVRFSYEMKRRYINEFLSDPLIDLSYVANVNVRNIECQVTNKETKTQKQEIRNVALRMNAIETIYKHLLPDVFNAIDNSNKKDQMLDIIKMWDNPTKRKMIEYIFNKSNSDKLNKILTNTRQQDPEANKKREALKKMVKLLLIDYIYEPEVIKVNLAQIWKIFQDDLDESIIIELLHNNGWILKINKASANTAQSNQKRVLEQPVLDLSIQVPGFADYDKQM